MRLNSGYMISAIPVIVDRTSHVREHTALEMLSTRKQLQSLIRELKSQGIKLDENKIF